MSGADAVLPPRTFVLSAAHVVGGALASRDWQGQHHDRDRATAMNLPDVILNTPSQLGWFCGFATAWSGPQGRIGRTAVRMSRPICPGDRITITGTVEDERADPAGWSWMLLALAMERGETIVSRCRMWIARPADAGSLPWEATADRWHPPEFDNG